MTFPQNAPGPRPSPAPGTPGAPGAREPRGAAGWAVRVAGVLVLLGASWFTWFAVALGGSMATGDCDFEENRARTVCTDWFAGFAVHFPMGVALLAACLGTYGALSRRPGRGLLWPMAMLLLVVPWVVVGSIAD
ncbi:hypothetical protein GQS52_16335 [Streptomyces sp. SCUT-3]|uniref:hypothetical protein n=1 Tax=Streptomyces TaxID=1883 RepID=UPI000CC41E7F|nr:MULTISPECIES: hypothetical protein [unclassified Streptomyces]MCZ2525633.1 hypothetical protein [Streptomyces sp. HB2AG]PLW71719.1 hypothetical protein C0036_16360 [Streptomyces sp. DJ]QMV23080.1 hypothetical protein GQS52_16335 [Streptomyces sp. SCUT-3]